jgi:hypothetical protein
MVSTLTATLIMSSYRLKKVCMHKNLFITSDILSDEAQRSDADEVKIIKKIYRSCVQRRDTSLVQSKQTT